MNEQGGSGIDTVQSAKSVVLSSAQFTGIADRNITGNGLANTLRSNAGDNEIDGGLGLDTMIGGGGNDTYVVNTGEMSWMRVPPAPAAWTWLYPR